jgi:hypothetical protein
MFKKIASCLIAVLLICMLTGCCTVDDKKIKAARDMSEINLDNWQEIIDSVEDPETLEFLEVFKENAEDLKNLLIEIENE